MRTRKAIEACANWLVLCLDLGWHKSCLPRLEEIWWEHHLDSGDLKPSPAAGEKL